MESNPNEDDSKSSSEEETDDHMGTGRSYECVFCKRGFTTAQALGGHMNIHRKDRAKNRPRGYSSSSFSSSTSDKFIDDNTSNNNRASFRSFSPTVQSYYPTTHTHHHQYINYQTYYPHQSTINNYDSYGKNIHQYFNLGLRIGESHLYHHVAAQVDHDKEKKQGVCEEDEVLDLELRLGHHDP